MQQEVSVSPTGASGSLALWVSVLGFLIMTTDGYDLQSAAFAAPALAAEWHVKRGAPGTRAGRQHRRDGVRISRPRLVRRIGPGARRALRACAWRCWRLARWVAGMRAACRSAVVVSRAHRPGSGRATPIRRPPDSPSGPHQGGAPLLWQSYRGRAAGSALVGAAVAQYIIPAYGWRSVFLLGAVLPSAFLVIALPLLPESPAFRARRAGADGGRWRMAPRHALQGLFDLVAPPHLPATLAIWARSSSTRSLSMGSSTGCPSCSPQRACRCRPRCAGRCSSIWAASSARFADRYSLPATGLALSAPRSPPRAQWAPCW